MKMMKGYKYEMRVKRRWKEEKRVIIEKGKR